MRGEIWLAELSPVRGSEAHKVRPVLIVGRSAVARAATQRDGTLTIVPLTSSIEHVYDFQVLIPGAVSGLDRDSKAQAEQIRTIATERLLSRAGAVPEEVSREVDAAIRLHLNL